MKRCPKCNRTFPDENQKFCTVDGGLLIGAPAFDPNVTIRATSTELGINTGDVPNEPGAATSRELPDLNATIAASSYAPTATFPRASTPTGRTTSSDLAPPPGLESTTANDIPAAAPQPAKKSKLPLIIGVLLILLVLGISGAVGGFFLFIKPRLEEFRGRTEVAERPVSQVETNEPPITSVSPTEATETTPAIETFVPPSDAVQFVNSRGNLDGRLAENYTDFSFYYPSSWRSDPGAGVPGAGNFVKVEKVLDEETGEYLLESATVSWYSSNGTYDSDLSIFPERARTLSSQISRGLPGYQKVSEGETNVNTLRGYEFKFQGVFRRTGKGDLPYWGRAIFLPPGIEGAKSGVVIILLATSLAPELSGVDDIGERGEMPLILESFRLRGEE